MSVEDEIRDALESIRNQVGETEVEASEISDAVANTGAKEFTEIDITEGFDPVNTDQSLIDISRTKQVENGGQVKINYSKRPRCPTCQHLPIGEDEPPTLVGECSQCGNQTCSNCKKECDYCGENLCTHCITSYASVERNPETLAMCQDCRSTQANIDEFERELKAWKVQLEHQAELVGKEIQFKELEFDRQQQQKQLEAELEIDRMKQAIEAEKVKNDRRKLELEETKAELEDKRERQKMQLEQEIKRRKTRLEEFEARVDAEIREREIELEREELVKEHEIEEKKQQLEAMEQLMEISKQEKVQTRKDWELLMDTRERMREMKWDEANDFLDFTGRLQNQDFQRVPGAEDDDEDDQAAIPVNEDEDIYVITGEDEGDSATTSIASETVDVRDDEDDSRY